MQMWHLSAHHCSCLAPPQQLCALKLATAMVAKHMCSGMSSVSSNLYMQDGLTVQVPGHQAAVA